MSTKFAFYNYFNKDRKVKNELKLAMWLAGEEVPNFARGKLTLNTYSINALLENKDSLTTIRLHNTEKFGDAIPIYAKLNTSSKNLEIRLGKEKGKECRTVEEMSEKIVYENISLGFLACTLMLMKGTMENFEESQSLNTLGGDNGAKKETGKPDLAALAADF